MATKTATHTVETLDAAAPNGQGAVKITCLCATCTEDGHAAITTKAIADSLNLAAPTKSAQTKVHNLVQLANGPFARTASARRTGPWGA